jgi:hypothetical protein
MSPLSTSHVLKQAEKKRAVTDFAGGGVMPISSYEMRTLAQRSLLASVRRFSRLPRGSLASRRLVIAPFGGGRASGHKAHRANNAGQWQAEQRQ